MSGATRSAIEVAIRVRPMRPEIRETKVAWELTPTTAREISNPDTYFTFDRVYGVDASTQQMYERSVRGSIVSRVAQGYNGTVFAYGQTGSGKTFTMFGEAVRDSTRGRGNRRVGLIELAVRDLFNALDRELQRSACSPLSTASPAGVFPTDAAGAGRMKHYEIFVSEMEIYNEQLRDLLLPEGQKAKPLSIRENEYGVYVHNALRKKVVSAEDCLWTIYKHAEARVSASTAMNEYSSRSHCITQIHVEKTVYLSEDSDDEDSRSQENEDDDGDDATATTEDDADHVSVASSSAASGTRGRGPQKRGQQTSRKAADTRKKKLVSLLNLVDLAGSERVAKTGAVGMRMVEGGHINKSLTTLTTVINRLAEINNAAGADRGGTANVFVPYRDSRLTHLLKTSIGGNSFTCIFCCVTPALENVDESRSTFQFASRAKRIKNRVSVNEVMNSKARVRELEVELRRVKRQLVAQTIYLWSKQVTIKNLQRRLGAFLGDDDDVDPRSAGVRQASTASFTSSQVRRRGGPDAQRQMIMAQLQARNETLEDELAKLKANGGGGGGPGTRPGSDGADDIARLKEDVTDLESMLEDMEREKKVVDHQVADLNGFCHELQTENSKQATQIKQLEEKVKEAEGLLDDLDDERSSAVSEAELLRAQLQKTQSRLLEKNRGDAYLEELTKLHIEHQALQYHHNQLKESSEKRVKGLQTQIADAEQEHGDLEDEKEEFKDRCKQLNAYLWRFLAIASLACKGRVDPELGNAASPHVERPVPEKEIADALESLTKAVSSSRVGGSPQTSSSAAASKKEATALKARVKQLESQIVQKDFQRDVLVDTKLKRMQDLVLRQHAMNTALIVEMRQCYSDNDELFRMAQKHPKLVGKLSKAGLFPRSLQSALERARFAEPVQKPFGHN